MCIRDRTGTAHGAQAGGEQLRCAGGAAIYQTHQRQGRLGLAVAAAHHGAVAVFILGVGHRALRHDQIDAADGVIQNAAAVVTQVKHQAGGTIGAQGADGVVQLTGGAAVELTDLDITHIAQHLMSTVVLV